LPTRAFLSMNYVPISHCGSLSLCVHIFHRTVQPYIVPLQNVMLTNTRLKYPLSSYRCQNGTPCFFPATICRHYIRNETRIKDVDSHQGKKFF
jgi:hypothetical protein